MKTGIRNLAGTAILLLCLFVSLQALAVAAQYSYDNLNRLIKIQLEDGTTVEYTYDEAGNRISRTVDVPTPVISSFSINNGASSTTSTSVTLNNAITGATPTQYMASESSSFTGATWQTYSTSPSFTLSSGYGTKTVYFKVENGSGAESTVANATISLVESTPIVSSFKINNDAPSTTNTGVTLNNTVTGGIPTQYMASESQSFTGATWQAYSTSPSFTLSSGYGTKTVYFKVKNGSGAESTVANATISLVESTPVVSAFKINNDVPSTTSTSVTLNNTVTGGTPTQYMASESPSFTGAAWQTYSTSPSFTLSLGYGTKTVYFKVKNGSGAESTIANATISLVEPAPLISSFSINKGASTTTSTSVTLNNIVTGATPIQYMASESSSFTGATWQTYSTTPSFTLSTGGGIKTIYFKAKNSAGESAPVSGTIQLVAPPAIVSFQINNGAATTSSRTVTLNNTATEPPTYYMASESSSFSGAAWKSYSAAPSFILSASNGTKTVYFKVKSTTGISAPVSAKIVLAQLPTVSSFKINGGATSTINPTVTINNTATISPTYYKASEDPNFTGAAWQAYSTAPSFTLTAGSGKKTVYFKVKNNAGESVPASSNIQLNLPPTVTSFKINNGAASTSSRTVTLNNTATENPTQYIASESSTFAGAVWQTYSAGPNFTLSAGNGTKTVYFKVRNAAGVSPLLSDSIVLAELSTVTSFKINGGATSSITQSVTLNNTATISPIQFMASESSNFTGAAWQTYSIAPKFTLSTGSGTRTVYFKVRNSVAESAAVSSTIQLIVKPTVTSFLINNGAATTSSRTITLNNAATESPAYYMASESSSFSGASWQTYSSAPNFTLSSPGSGTKKVYFQVKNAAGVSNIVSNAITLLDNPPAFGSASLPSSVTFPGKTNFSGTVTDDNGLASISMKISGPKGDNITAFTSSLNGKSASLAGYYFNSSNTSYAGLAGNYTVTLTVTDTAGQSTSLNFPVYVVVINPQVNVSPVSGDQGTTFSEPGTGFTPNNTATLHFQKPDGSQTPTAPATTSGTGEYVHSWTSSTSDAAGTYYYWAVDDTTGKKSTTVSFAITAYVVNPQVSVNPTSGPQGTLFYAPGAGFTPNSTATLHFQKPFGPEYPTVSESTDASGAYSYPFTSSTANPLGTYQYWAIDNTTGKQSDTATFKITDVPTLNDPPQPISDGFRLTWTQVPSATSYKLYWSNVWHWPVPWAGVQETSNTVFEHTGLVAGQRYNYGVTACNGSYCSALSNIVYAYYYSLANKSSARRWGTATLVLNGKVLVTGGEGASGLVPSEIFDPTTGTWALVTPMSTARQEHTATLLPDGRVLVTGGLDDNLGALNSAEVYDPATDTWTPAASMNFARYSHTATLLPSGKVLVAGGCNGTTLQSAEVYDPTTDSWELAAPMSTRYCGHTATLLKNGGVLLIGGEYNNGFFSVEVYDSATNTWAPAAKISTSRENNSATLLPDGRVLVAGGWSLSSAEVYDPTANAWASVASMNSVRDYHTATLLPDGKVLVTGGRDGSGQVLNSTEVYDPIMDTWTPYADMSTARMIHTATLLNGGKVLVTGGGGALSNPDIFY